jgi:primosomal replication protein N
MDKKVQIGGKFKIAMIVLIALGLIVTVVGFLSGEETRTWANLLLGHWGPLSG